LTATPRVFAFVLMALVSSKRALAWVAALLQPVRLWS
jgi:hypothetical protein